MAANLPHDAACTVAFWLVTAFPTVLTIPTVCPLLAQVLENKRYAGNEGWTVSETAAKVCGAGRGGVERAGGCFEVAALQRCMLLESIVEQMARLPVPALLHTVCSAASWLNGWAFTFHGLRRWPRTGARWTSWCTPWPTAPRCASRGWLLLAAPGCC